jgi:hypothetical protein
MGRPGPQARLRMPHTIDDSLSFEHQQQSPANDLYFGVALFRTLPNSSERLRASSAQHAGL